MWLIIALLGYLLLSLVLLLDKFILTKAITSPAVYTFWSTVFVLPLLLAAPFVGPPLAPVDMLIAGSAGLTFGLALLTLYTGVQRGEATHVYPFNGAVLIVATYGIARLLLGEALSPSQVIGVFILGVASLFLTAQKKHLKMYWSAFWWAGVSGLLFALSLTIVKYLYQAYPFATALLWSQGMVGITAVLILLVSPRVRQSVFNHRRGAKKKSKGKAGIVVANKVLSVTANLLIQVAIALGSVTLVNALSGFQYVLVFVFMLILTRFWPRVLKEQFTRREIIVQAIAICLVAGGAVLVAL